MSDYTNEGRKGITIVEVVVGLAILMLSFGALLLTFTRIQHSAVSSQNSLSAMHIARNEIELFRTGSYSNIIPYTNVVLTNTVFTGLRGKKNCAVVTNADGYKNIELTITWVNPVKSDLSLSSLSINTLICSTNL